jgi:hypothetical protein
MRGYFNYSMSNITRSKNNMIIVSIFIATLATLTSHIFIQKAVTPLIQKMQQEMTVSENYSFFVILCAYITAFIQTSLTVFLYFNAGHILNIKNKMIKILVLTAIMLELKGSLIREPFMNFVYNIQLGMKNPFLFSILMQLDRWIPNLLLSACLVYLCPLKTKHVDT